MNRSTQVQCDQCKRMVDDDETVRWSRSMPHVCRDCDADADADYERMFPGEEPVDEGLAYEDRLDRWGGREK